MIKSVGKALLLFIVMCILIYLFANSILNGTALFARGISPTFHEYPFKYLLVVVSYLIIFSINSFLLLCEIKDIYRAFKARGKRKR